MKSSIRHMLAALDLAAGVPTGTARRPTASSDPSKAAAAESLDWDAVVADLNAKAGFGPAPCDAATVPGRGIAR